MSSQRPIRRESKEVGWSQVTWKYLIKKKKRKKSTIIRLELAVSGSEVVGRGKRKV